MRKKRCGDFESALRLLSDKIDMYDALLKARAMILRLNREGGGCKGGGERAKLGRNRRKKL